VHLYALRLAAGFGEGATIAAVAAALGGTAPPDRNFAIFVACNMLLSAVMFRVLPPLLVGFGINGVFGALLGPRLNAYANGFGSIWAGIVLMVVAVALISIAGSRLRRSTPKVIGAVALRAVVLRPCQPMRALRPVRRAVRIPLK
jgi:MFS family permease